MLRSRIVILVTLPLNRTESELRNISEYSATPSRIVFGVVIRCMLSRATLRSHRVAIRKSSMCEVSGRGCQISDPRFAQRLGCL